MDLRPRAVGTGPGWTWPEDDATRNADRTREDLGDSHAGGSSSQGRQGTAATSSGYDYRYVHYGEHTAHAYLDETLPSDASDGTAETEEAAANARIYEQYRQRVHEQEQFRRRYKSRTCRICLEVIYPTFETTAEEDLEQMVAAAGAEDDGGIGGISAAIRERIVGAMNSAIPTFLRPKPRVRYVSQTPEDGRLISPCHCKGSQKYVHEGCLQAWRHSQPLRDRNYWKCPTCGFEYRLERLRWGRLISNRVTRVFLTFAVFWLAIFLLGFIADPLIDMWLDPGGMIVETIQDLTYSLDVDDTVLERMHAAARPPPNRAPVPDDDFDFVGADWVEHFLKGFFSLGIFGVVKTFLAVSPFTWWNLRGAGVGRARRRAGGQARIEGFGWAFVIIGAFTFLGVVWKGISFLSGLVLERASERVVDIQGGDDNADDGSDDDDNDNDEDNDDDHDGSSAGEHVPKANPGSHNG